MNERLTEKITNMNTGEILAYRFRSVSAAEQIKAARKLGEYEDAEEQGRLLVLPCNTVWDALAKMKGEEHVH